MQTLMTDRIIPITELRDQLSKTFSRVSRENKAVAVLTNNKIAGYVVSASEMESLLAAREALERLEDFMDEQQLGPIVQARLASDKWVEVDFDKL